MSRVRAASAVLLLAHLLAVAWATLRPRSVLWVSPTNLRPFTTIRADLAGGPQEALHGIGGGLLLLAPLGVLLPLATGQLRRGLAGTAFRTTVAGALVALAIALAQTGVPGQVGNVDAVMLNTAGVGAAYLLLYPPLRRWLLRGGGTGRGGVRARLRRVGPYGLVGPKSRVGLRGRVGLKGRTGWKGHVGRERRPGLRHHPGLKHHVSLKDEGARSHPEKSQGPGSSLAGRLAG
ncbi:VanZ family protein [Streptomyces sp. NPDC054784]